MMVHCPSMEGIIPARAGFTIEKRAGSENKTDHPRSRGVYPIDVEVGVRSWGSSPLARGLRRLRRPAADRGGIIPARAGFTLATHAIQAGTPDHPRSRGVYLPATASVWTGVGSSPLARGLRADFPRFDVHGGIIPARAGFTFNTGISPETLRDHPRSRGVYSGPRSTSRLSTGSSPLARGLPLLPQWMGQEGGDHPRSRGVYGTELSPSLIREGSSPLARGLRDCYGVEPSPGRIIPARAGFTAGGAVSRDDCLDHPRSRGVYSVPTTSDQWDEGSSPLARGLLVATPKNKSIVRIIPARAGFTGTGPGRCQSHQDHPRSRGVYWKVCCRGHRRGDHPRSRGVYRVDS